MKKDEKELIFNLLKTIDSNFNGYTRENFKKDYIFQDDETAENLEKSVDENIEEIASENTTVAIEKASDTDVQSTADQTVTSQNLNTKGITLQALTEKIHRCTRCGLARTRNNVVPGQGVEHPLVMVIGEGPGYDEDMQGQPFVGKAGILLDKMLAAIQLDRKTNCYIANIVKCRPPQNRDPAPDEQAACISFLEAQIHILKPKMILCMGRISGQKILNSDLPVGKLRGNFGDYNGIPVMVTYHPSALLRNADLKRPAWEDLKLFRTKLLQLDPNYQQKYLNGGN